MVIIMDTGEGMAMDTGPVMPQAIATPTGMYIIIVVRGSGNPVPGGMHRLQTILTTGHGLQTSQITCTLIKAGMFTSAIRMATTKTSRTGSNPLPVSNLLLVSDLPPVSNHLQVSDLLPASSLPPISNPLLVNSHVLNRARCKAIRSNKWTGPIRTGARGHKIITVHNSTSNKTGVDQAVQAVADQEEPGLAVAVAGDGNLKY